VKGNGGNREPATGNRGRHQDRRQQGHGTGERKGDRPRRATFSRPPRRTRVADAAKDNNGGNREPATGNRGGIRNTVITAGTRDRGPGTGDQGPGRRRPKRQGPGTGTATAETGGTGNWQPGTGNRELAIGSDEQYQKSPSWPGTGRSCRLFLRPVRTRCAGSCY